MAHLSRRDFLKLSAAGLYGLFLSKAGFDTANVAAEIKQGRTVISGLKLYQDPSFNAKVLEMMGRDKILNITRAVEGDFGPGNPYNNRWFQIEDGGYAYSGWIQPVETHYQQPVFEIPAAGQLGEVTVPYSDSSLTPSVRDGRGYRVYYATTHWITGMVANRAEKSLWYEIRDSLLRISLYLPTSGVRLVPSDELAPLSADVPEGLKRIYVDVGTQSVTAFEDDRSVLIARCSSGAKGTRTPLGEFQTFHKGSTIHMANDGEGSGYDLPGVPWVSFFTGTGIAFHGTYWHNNFGQPLSHGCVNLSPTDAKFIYRWTRPVIPPDTQYLYKPGEGTRVQVAASNS